MKQNAVYYLLFMVLILGAFASMAQDDYGITILGLAAFAFALLFAFQLWSLIKVKEDGKAWKLLELSCLFILATIMGLRVFYIHFVFVKLLFGLSGVVLVVVYTNKLIVSYRSLNTSGRWLPWLLVCFYLSLILFTLSMVVTPFVPVMTMPTGAAAFFLLITFVALASMQRNLLVNGEKVSPLVFVYRLKDHSVMLMSLYLLFAFYIGLTSVGVLPKLYSNEFPRGYYQLVEEAEKGKAKMVKGKYKHEEFKEMHDRFLEHHAQ